MVKKTKDLQYYQAVGRRKESVATVRLYIVGKDKTATIKGKKVNQGSIIVNDKPIQELFSGLSEQKRYIQPLELTDSVNRFAVSIVVNGGGRNGQLEAIIHGISRALQSSDESVTHTLKEYDLLTRDPRSRERRKVGTGGKARRAKQSPKR
jgi:small subunit ribosomal protein S9